MKKFEVNLTVHANAVVRVTDEVANQMTPEELLNFVETTGVTELDFGDLKEVDVHTNYCNAFIEPAPAVKRYEKPVSLQVALEDAGFWDMPEKVITLSYRKSTMITTVDGVKDCLDYEQTLVSKTETELYKEVPTFEVKCTKLVRRFT